MVVIGTSLCSEGVTAPCHSEKLQLMCEMDLALHCTWWRLVDLEPKFLVVPSCDACLLVIMLPAFMQPQMGPEQQGGTGMWTVLFPDQSTSERNEMSMFEMNLQRF